MGFRRLRAELKHLSMAIDLADEQGAWAKFPEVCKQFDIQPMRTWRDVHDLFGQVDSAKLYWDTWRAIQTAELASMTTTKPTTDPMNLIRRVMQDLARAEFQQSRAIARRRAARRADLKDDQLY